MKRVALCVLLAALCVGALCFAEGKEPKDPKDKHLVQGDIPFSYSYEEALAACKENGKPLFVYFTYEG